MNQESRKAGSGTVAIGSVMCFAGVILVAIGMGAEAKWLSGTGGAVLLAGFFTAVLGRLAG